MTPARPWHRLHLAQSCRAPHPDAVHVDVVAPPAALTPACLNWAATLAGPFCTTCGQSAATPERVTFRSLWTDFRINKLGLDRGLLVTVRDVLTRPGAVALAFVEGRRQTSVHPVTFLADDRIHRARHPHRDALARADVATARGGTGARR